MWASGAQLLPAPARRVVLHVGAFLPLSQRSSFEAPASRLGLLGCRAVAGLWVLDLPWELGSGSRLWVSRRPLTPFRIQVRIPLPLQVAALLVVSGLCCHACAFKAAGT